MPTFSSDAEERRFWETLDTSASVDWTKARVAVFPRLKPSTWTISLRLPPALLAELKALPNKRDVPYQSLLNVSLAERIAHENPQRTPTGCAEVTARWPFRDKETLSRSPRLRRRSF